ncbi:MAG: alpha/beta fold hydrolase [Actinomycetota bacterium]
MTRLDVNGLSFNVLDEGSGTPVLLLHGFPDNSRLWRNVIPSLTAAGYRTIAPDMRGFGESDRPGDVAEYRLDKILADVTGILDALGVERAHVVGHDFGAVISWVFAMLQPDRVDHLVAISVGAPGGEPRSIQQQRASWYMFAFQFPGVTEEWLMRDDWRVFDGWLDGTYPDLATAKQELSRPGALTAALNWYRGLARPEVLLGARLPLPQVKAPTLGIWSDGDIALLESQMTSSENMVAGPWRYERIEGVGHWIPLEAAERLNELLLEFFATPA